MAANVAILALTISAFLLVVPPANSERPGFRATMIRRQKAINYTRAAQQSYERLSLLAARLDAASVGASTQTSLRADGVGAYDMEVSIGTPPQKLTALADTGSDLVWMKCGPCASCTPQGSHSYDPTGSFSFSKLACSDRLCVALKSQASCGGGGTQCDYKYSYGLKADHYTQGYMGSETFTIGSEAVSGVGFGCTTMSTGNYGTGSGLVGLGRGPLSLVSQLGVGAFSYCLIPPDTSMASPLLFGSMATLTGAGVQSTGLLDSNSPTLYAVNLQSISIGTATMPGTGTNGLTIFDSGTTLTYLAEPAYTAARRSLLTQTLLPQVANSGYETCFQASQSDISSTVPPMVLHFDGADMELPTANIFIEVGGGVICWVVQSSPSKLSIIGNIMQMNYHIRYDLENKVLSFQQANCDSL